MHFQREQVSGDKEDREESGGGEEKKVKTKKKKIRLDPCDANRIFQGRNRKVLLCVFDIDVTLPLIPSLVNKIPPRLPAYHIGQCFFLQIWLCKLRNPEPTIQLLSCVHSENANLSLPLVSFSCRQMSGWKG